MHGRRPDTLWEGIRLTLEAAPIPMLLVAEDGSVRLANEAACALVGCDEQALRQLDIEALVPDSARGHHAAWRSSYQQDPVRRAMGTGRDLALQRIDGTTVPVEVGLNPMNVDGEPFVICSVLDLTERLRAEQDRSKLEAEASEADRLRSLEMLAGGVAHDFNNVLVSVLGNASLLKSTLDPESELVEWVGDIEAGATRAAELAKQMLAFSGGGRFVVEPTDVSALLRGFVPLLRSLVPKTVTVRTWLEDDLPTSQVDRGQIRQVITNLVGNAASMMTGGGTIGIRTSSYRMTSDWYAHGTWVGHRFEGPAVSLEISDDGPGIPEGALRRIFEPFYSTREAGHGMGLAAVLGIVRAHDGCLSVYSVQGEGAIFKVFLPAEDDAKPKRSPDSPRAQETAIKVLVIDDEASVLRLVARALGQAGYSTLVESDPQVGVDTFRALHEDIALVLLDLSMPNMDGHRVFEELKRIDPTVRAVVMSGFSEKEIEVRFSGRVVGTLAKPFTTERLVETVEATLARTRNAAKT